MITVNYIFVGKNVLTFVTSYIGHEAEFGSMEIINLCIHFMFDENDNMIIDGQFKQ